MFVSPLPKSPRWGGGLWNGWGGPVPPGDGAGLLAANPYIPRHDVSTEKVNAIALDDVRFPVAWRSPLGASYLFYSFAGQFVDDFCG